MVLRLPVTNRSMNHVGLFVGIQTVAVVALDRKGTAPQQAVYESPKLLLSAAGVYEEALREAVLALKQKLTFPSRLVAVCFPEKMAFTRTHHLPKLSIPEIDEALTWQTEKLFPYEPKEIYTDWRLLRRSSNETLVAVTAVPRTIIDGMKNALLATGLFPVAFESSVSALARLVPTSAKAQAIVIEIDAIGAAATIVIDGVAQMTATCFFESQFDFQQRLKQIANSVKELTAHWLRESPQKTPFSIFVTGMIEPVVAEQLQAFVAMKCVALDVAGLPMIAHGAYAAASGLVLPPESESTINLMPTGLKRFYEAANVHETFTILRKILIGGWGVAAVLGLIFFILVTVIASQKYTAVNNSKTGDSTVTASDLETITRNAVRYKRLYQKKSTPEMLLSKVFAAIPPETVIKTAIYNPVKKILRLSGTAPGREAVILVHQRLMETELFNKTDLPLSILNTTSTGDFTFELGEKKS